MVFEELQQRYGAYVAELVRQNMTLETFSRLELEELVPYFELRAERTYEEYRSRVNTPLPDDGPLMTHEQYMDILHRRWQKAEEIAHMILEAEKMASDAEVQAITA